MGVLVFVSDLQDTPMLQLHNSFLSISAMQQLQQQD